MEIDITARKCLPLESTQTA